ncbi:MAG: hypothetical protein H0W72_06440, partial [Planctomycetes bacterium]|nr:hypothetical protein [Planctomycetota bacterium]
LQSVLVTLAQLSPADLGAWLTAFRAAGNPWRIAELQCAHHAAAPGAQPAGAALDSNRYTVSVLLHAPYLEDPP